MIRIGLLEPEVAAWESLQSSVQAILSDPPADVDIFVEQLEQALDAAEDARCLAERELPDQ